MKIYLSKNTVEKIIANDCQITSAADDFEAEIMRKTVEELKAPRDEKNRINLSRDTFDFVIAALDWCCSAYWNEHNED